MQLAQVIDDTIAAISTPIGEGGINIVRLSGRDSFFIAERFFVAKNKKQLKDAKSHSIIYGHIIEGGCIIDEVLVMLMRSPRTYTKEDVVEINCHGGQVVAERILHLCVRHGARLAEPGEFTKRAFLNGRIDLSQAEAVLDVIKSKTDLTLQYSMNQLCGGLSKEIKQLKTRLIDVLARLEVGIDFPEEDIDISYQELSVDIEDIRQRIRALFETSGYGIILREGAKTIICGRPNVGKSSLLNALLKLDRAIVTPIPGTTRDTIEETVNIKGLAITLVDTAGIAQTNDIVESEGINRARQALRQADLCLVVIDSSCPICPEDRYILEQTKDKKRIVVLNKIDLLNADFRGFDTQICADKVCTVKTSCLTQEGIPQLEDTIYKTILDGSLKMNNEVIVTNIRHRLALERSYKCLSDAVKAIGENLSPEFISIDVRGSVDALGEIVGDVVNDDILERVFSQFCIGK